MSASFQSPGIHPVMRFHLEGVEYAQRCVNGAREASPDNVSHEVRRLLDQADAMIERAQGIHSVADPLIDQLMGGGGQ